MVKLSIVVGGTYDPNSTYSSFDPLFAEDEDERITLPGLIMLPEEPRISYKHHSIHCISLDYLPVEEESLYF